MTPANDNNPRPATFDTTVMQMLPFLRKLAWRFEQSQDHEDLVQDTIALALHRWASYDNVSSFAGWLAFQMRECRKARLPDKGRPAKPLYSPTTSVAPTQDTQVQLTQVVAAIRPRYRSMMARLAVGYDPIEIASEDGVSRQAIHQRILACRARLKKVVG